MLITATRNALTSKRNIVGLEVMQQLTEPKENCSFSSPAYDQILPQPEVLEPDSLRHCEATVAAIALLLDLHEGSY